MHRSRRRLGQSPRRSRGLYQVWCAGGGRGVRHVLAGPVLPAIAGGLAALVEPPEAELTGVVGGEFVLIAISCLLMSG